MDAKASAAEKLKQTTSKLIDLSHRIHSNPELGYQEEKASLWISELLADAGFSIDQGICDVPTAFAARYGSGPLHIVVCAEYDALPSIGHACGHNIIAAASTGAAIAAAKIADDIGLTITLMGTPAEEVLDKGGKILLLEKGAFRDAHAAMMVHPAPLDMVEMPIIAAAAYHVKYKGKSAHASAFPEEGINAADALTIAQTSIGLLRQHLRPSDRVHGIVTKGGDAANIVPADTEGHFYIRAHTLEDLETVRKKVFGCFEAGAVGSGSELTISGGDRPYAQMHHNSEIASLYRRNAEATGRIFPDLGTSAERSAASTDMGNVSLALPSIHPSIGIDSLPAVNHQPEFTAHCARPSADKAVYDGAMAMVWTMIDMANNDALRSRLIARE